MIKMSRDAFERSRRFVETSARPLEVARFHFHFDGAPAGEVLTELARFQNPDGGFGRALESDLRAPESSALATSMAFQVLREVGVRGDNPMIATAMRYLLRTLDQDQGTWRIVPPGAESSPHAPWWTQTGQEERFSGFSLNPTAELLGYLAEYPAEVPASVPALLIDRIGSHLDGLESIEMHDLLCCRRLVESEGLEPGFRSRLVQRLTSLLPGVVAIDPGQWSGYCLRPLQVADRPGSPFIEPLRQAVARNLEYEVETQLDDGSWPVTWSWGDLYPEVFALASVEWAGVFAVEKLLTLRRFGWIEGVG